MDRDSRRKVSHAVFGNAYVLEVGAAIAHWPKESFTQQDIAQALAADKGVVRTAFMRLASSALIEHLPKDGPKHPYQKVGSVMWEAFLAFERELGGDSQAEQPADTVHSSY
jgi:hypothetical protein